MGFLAPSTPTPPPPRTTERRTSGRDFLEALRANARARKAQQDRGSFVTDLVAPADAGEGLVIPKRSM